MYGHDALNRNANFPAHLGRQREKNEDERNWRVAPPERSVNASSLYSVTYSEREVKLNFVALSLIRKICITLAAPNAERLANEV